MHIHLSKKLEKLLKKFTNKKSSEPDSSQLGKWNATVFYVDRKKCLLFLNAQTTYSFILVNVVAKDYPNLHKKIKEELYEQLSYDGILLAPKQFLALLGEIRFLPTDADRRALGFINYKLDTINHFLSIESISVDLLCHRLNSDLFNTGPGPKYQNMTTPIAEMKRVVEGIQGD
ncbi:DUF6933 domain-containing protein [Algoriphagus algorifonticola]|uniref:DUF6933 domain-containing protein n=1 Tax=Algoriphagus algorifonticola TaxID=2593007 RepID=UPI0011A51944|nr:hypothetical protein [Algoriphagus algorifonticola]